MTGEVAQNVDRLFNLGFQAMEECVRAKSRTQDPHAPVGVPPAIGVFADEHV